MRELRAHRVAEEEENALLFGLDFHDIPSLSEKSNRGQRSEVRGATCVLAGCAGLGYTSNRGENQRQYSEFTANRWGSVGLEYTDGL